VLIELGAAIGMRRPYFYFNYGKKRTVKINNRNEPITTASDLAGMLHLPYTDYRGLFVEFARRLPGFLVDRNLARWKQWPPSGGNRLTSQGVEDVQRSLRAPEIGPARGAVLQHHKPMRNRG
jgi:hypothetical protein